MTARIPHRLRHALSLAALLPAAALLSACGGGGGGSDENALTEITLQTDWYAQAEHGGFYQAKAEGYYEAEGLDVTILQGGPNAMTAQKVASGTAEFAIGRSDDVLVHASRGIPIVLVAALMQHDPQALLYHKENPIKSFEDLDGRSVMTTPGSVFIEFLKKKYDISIEVIPLDYGMSRFLADKNFIQQCFITNEPYYVEKEGANAGTLLISESGFDPYRVIYANRPFAQKNPEITKAFVRASIRGWNSYMEGPREKANALIRERNPKMTPEFLDFSVGTMAENNLISGTGPREATGLLDPARIREQIDALETIGMLDKELDAESIAPLRYLPEKLRSSIN